MVIFETIKEVYKHQQDILTDADLGIDREILPNMVPLTSQILIISGIRRCGKSTLMRQLLRNLPGGYAFLNFEDPRLDSFDLQDFIKFDKVIDQYKPEVFAFDEIQNVPGWEKYCRTKQDEKYKVLLTGSNASMLSREFGTRLTGRYIRKELFPFSYKEFLSFTNEKPGADSLENFVNRGGFPEFLKSREEDILFHILDDIIYRDIAVRYGIRNHQLLRQMAIYLISNSAKMFTLNSLKKTLEVPSPRTVADYVSYFEDSYLLFSLPKFSYSLRKQIVNPRKVYCIDTGLAGTNSLSLSRDYGRKLENLVFLHLRKQTKNLFYFSEEYECDFILVDKGEVKKALQVCYSLNQDNLDREISGLTTAMDTFNLNNGYIITFDQEDVFKINRKSIRAIPAWKWLIE